MHSFTISKAIKQAYRRGESEEVMEPIVLTEANGRPIGRIQDGDQVIFYDIRGEREIELTSSFVEPDFDYFKINPHIKTDWVTMIEYNSRLPVKVAFPPSDEIADTLSSLLSRAGIRQYLISESEKAIHVGFFFNGKRSEFHADMEKVIIPSPEGAGNYESTPKMNAKGVADETIRRMDDHNRSFLLVNFCNVDVLGHTENREAILDAVNTVDQELSRVVQTALLKEYVVLVTADHGTAERYLYPDGSIDTGHTISQVPFIFIESKNKTTIRPKGSLIDVAPTVLDLFEIKRPSTMSGNSLIQNLQKIQDHRVLLIILDGWGYNPDTHGNLIHEAKTPFFDEITKQYASTFLEAAGEAVGLPKNTVGNSEVGHLHLGVGRIVPSDKVRIQYAMDEGSFYRNKVFRFAMSKAKETEKNLHLLGIVSFFSSHGSIYYALALLKMAKEQGVRNVYLHGLLGRRGERPESGAYYIRKIEDECIRLGVGQVASVIGRHWALDREENWDRIEKTYRMLVFGEGHSAPTNK